MTQERYWDDFQRIVNVVATMKPQLHGYEVVMATPLPAPTDQVPEPAAVSQETRTRLERISHEILEGTCTSAGVCLYLKNRQTQEEAAITLINRAGRYVLEEEITPLSSSALPA